MGYRGKVAEQERARELRAKGLTLVEIATELGVSKSSISIWVRDVVFTPRPRQRPTFVSPHPMHLAKLAEIEDTRRRGVERVANLTGEAFFAGGIALYAGEGGKTDGAVSFANCDVRMIRYFCCWLRTYFEIDESRLRVSLYLHAGLDLEAAERHWSAATDIPVPSSASRIGRFRTRASAAASTSTGSPGWTTRARGRTARSWVSSRRCYRQPSFRGSSVGRATDC